MNTITAGYTENLTDPHAVDVSTIIGIRRTVKDAALACGARKLCRGWSGSISVFVDEAVASGCAKG
jgi:hypothetical protein